jgi:hypothetical protein
MKQPDGPQWYEIAEKLSLADAEDRWRKEGYENRKQWLDQVAARTGVQYQLLVRYTLAYKYVEKLAKQGRVKDIQQICKGLGENKVTLLRLIEDQSEDFGRTWFQLAKAGAATVSELRSILDQVKKENRNQAITFENMKSSPMQLDDEFVVAYDTATAGTFPFTGPRLNAVTDTPIGRFLSADYLIRDPRNGGSAVGVELDDVGVKKEEDLVRHLAISSLGARLFDEYWVVCRSRDSAKQWAGLVKGFGIPAFGILYLEPGSLLGKMHEPTDGFGTDNLSAVMQRARF